MIKASVIICTYNRKDKLYLALLGYQRQSCKDFEVIVTSDGSSDGTDEMVEQMRNQVDYPLHYLWQEDIGFRKSRAANHAIKEAKGDILIFADDDMIPPVGYVQNYIRVFEKHPGKELLVYSKYLPVTRRDYKFFTAENIRSGAYMSCFTLRKKIKLLVWGIKYRYYFAIKHPLRPKLNGGNFAVSAGAVRAVNGFDQDFSGWGYEDDDLRRRLLAYKVLQTEAVYRAFVFNFGYEKMDKTTADKPEMFDRVKINKAMAHDSGRPTVCSNGLNCPEDTGKKF